MTPENPCIQILAAKTDPQELERLIRQRLAGEYGPCPYGDEWRWSDLLLNAMEEGDATAWKQAVLGVLHRLEENPGDGNGPKEWPVGIFLLLGQVLWREEKRTVEEHLVAIAKKALDVWPTTVDEDIPGCYAPAIDLFRTALRFNSTHRTALTGLGEKLVRRIQKIRVDTPSPKANWALGKALGLWVFIGGTGAKDLEAAIGFIHDGAADTESWSQATKEMEMSLAGDQGTARPLLLAIAAARERYPDDPSWATWVDATIEKWVAQDKGAPGEATD